MSVRLAPSILAADFAALGVCIAAAERGGADMIHVDVMDGHFVPNLTVGPPVVRSIRKATTLPLDVHLMIEDADRFVPAFAEAGASLISVHVEALPHLHRTLGFIKSLGLKAGAVLNPSTPVGCLEEVASDVDFVLIMTVNPGFGGQTFISRSTSKIQAMRALLDEARNPVPIEVDGGMDEHTVSRVVGAGADWIVAGTAVFGSPDVEAATRRLKAVAVAAAQDRLAAPRSAR